MLKTHLLPLHVFVPIFLRATRKPELADPRSLDMLCHLIVDTSAEMPLSTLLSTVEPLEPLAASLLDAYNILRLALSSPLSPLHDLQSSSQELLFLLLQYNQAVLTHLTPSEALQVYSLIHPHTQRTDFFRQFLTIGHEILAHSNVRPDLANVLGNINRILGELLTVADALPAAHPEMLTIGLPPPELPPTEISDIVSLSLFLRNIVSSHLQESIPS